MNIIAFKLIVLFFFKHRYPEDPYDRIWEPFSYSPYWTPLSTGFKVANLRKDLFEVPSAALQTAVIPTNSTSLKFFWDARRETDGTISEYHIFMHFAEIQTAGANSTRTFDVYLNGELWEGSFSPNFLVGGHIYTTSPGTLYQYNFSLIQGNTSILPPILNAMEIYTSMHHKELATDFSDCKLPLFAPLCCSSKSFCNRYTVSLYQSTQVPI